MPTVQGALTVFDGFAVEPGDISFGEAESMEISVNRGGRATKASLVRRSVSIRLRGIPKIDADRYIGEARNGPISVVRGNTGRNLQFGIDRIESAVLMKATAQQPILITGEGVTFFLVPEIQLEYQSQVFI